MLPIYDAFSMMIRRLLKRRSPFRADREHLHHIFLLAGFSVGESVTLMTGIAVAGVAIGLGSVYLQVPELIVSLMFVAGGGLYYWMMRRAWRVMRFLRRSISRRGEIERRAGHNRRVSNDIEYGVEKRSGLDRRKVGDRRSAAR
jgi:UDP-GlcNAc:undecaprenyl-phosphate GlcNAc-1-phosphate transferase